MKNALLVLENGYSEAGKVFAGEGTVFAEFIFNTSMSGYEKIISDPSYKEQVIVFTYPLIGNYGVNEEFFESDNIHASAIVVREYNDFYSHYAAKKTLKELLVENNILGLTSVDTRELTLNIRKYGAIKGAISTEYMNKEKLLDMVRKSPSIEKKNPVLSVVKKDVVRLKGSDENSLTLLILDFGIKKSIIENLRRYFGEIILFPYSPDFIKKLQSHQYDAVFLSNGPGDPRIIKDVDNFALKTIEKRVPIIGICFGHQLIGKAFGMEIIKLPFGHHGGNHPVKNTLTNKVYITAQNHNYAISKKSVEDSKEFYMNWVNLYDGTVEGIVHKELPIYTVQFHPEAAPGPNDPKELVFEEMFEIVRKNAHKKRY